MIISEYLKLCHDYIMPQKKSIVEFMIDFFIAITIECPDEVEEAEYYIFYNTDKPDKAKKVYSGTRNLSKRDTRFMKNHFDEERLMELIEKMEPYAQQQLMDALGKYDIDTDYSNLSEKMCRLFVEILDSQRTTKKETSEEKNKRVELIEKYTYSDEIIDKARRFCRKYNDQLSLLPLCQIALNISPINPCNREMYNAFIEADKPVRDAIMQINSIPIFEFRDNWEFCYLNWFDEDIKKLGLSSISIFYDNGKYFHNIIHYPDYVPEDMDPYGFPKVPNRYAVNLKYNNLVGYIDEFIYYKNDEKLKKYVHEAPLDYLWRVKSLAECPEKDIVFWLNLFVYSACFVIPREFRKKKTQTIRYNAPSLYEIKTYEDLYFSSLMCLYDVYNSIKRVNKNSKSVAVILPQKC